MMSIAGSCILTTPAEATLPSVPFAPSLVLQPLIRVQFHLSTFSSSTTSSSSGFSSLSVPLLLESSFLQSVEELGKETELSSSSSSLLPSSSSSSPVPPPFSSSSPTPSSSSSPPSFSAPHTPRAPVKRRQKTAKPAATRAPRAALALRSSSRVPRLGATSASLSSPPSSSSSSHSLPSSSFTAPSAVSSSGLIAPSASSDHSAQSVDRRAHRIAAESRAHSFISKKSRSTVIKRKRDKLNASVAVALSFEVVSREAQQNHQG